MIKLVYFFLGLFISQSLFASELTYYKGQQFLTDEFGTRACYVEIESHDGEDSVHLRTLVGDAHDANETVGFGPLEADFDSDLMAYIYTPEGDEETVRELVLSLTGSPESDEMVLQLKDEGHAGLDETTCFNLSVAENTELLEAEELFEHFEDYVGEEGHDHGDGDHGDDHGDDHDDDDDHGDDDHDHGDH